MPNFVIQNQMFPLRDNVCTDDGTYMVKPNQYCFYIKIPNICNANCSFCNKCDEEIPFDVPAMRKAIIDTMAVAPIVSFSITGGEPFLDVDLLLDIVMTINQLVPKPNITINTNGTNIEEAVRFEPFITKLHVSRHHYSDLINRSIFGSNEVPNLDRIKKVIAATRRDFIQFNCLLIKGFIDSAEEVERYLRQDMFSTGFIGLMPINEFSKRNFVDFRTIFPIAGHLNSVNYTNPQYDGEKLRTTCSCMRNLFMLDDHTVEYYARSVEWLECPINNFIIFNGQKLVGSFLD